MNPFSVYALSKDSYWLKALAEIADESVVIELLPISDHPEYLRSLPITNDQALLLVDTAAYPDVVSFVRQLIVQGWRFVVVVAAIPSWKETRSLLREAGAYDYWQKSYATKTIRSAIKGCITQIEEDTSPHHKV
jgi:hypothetical protein